MQTPLDILGKPIEAGCEIVYGSLLGRSAALSRGHVIEVLPSKDSTPTNERYSIKVQRLKSDGTPEMHSRWWYDEATKTSGYHDEKPAAPVRLNFPERIVVVKSA